MNVLIRTDSSLKIGSGHVMRTLTLADELRHRGAEVTFLTREHPGNMNNFLKSEKNFPVISLSNPTENTFQSSNEYENNTEVSWLGISWEEDCDETKEKIKAVLPNVGLFDWLVVDHYSLDAQWESSLREVVENIMVIDDLADRKHDADILLDQNLYDGMERRYDGLIPEECSKLLGPKYALLRPQFAKARASLRKRDGQIRRILVFYGGSDFTDETTKTINALSAPEFSNIALDFVVGGLNPRKDQILNSCEKLINAQCHFNIDYMARLMSEADLFIGSGGTSTWERCYLGLPSVIIAVAKNQEELSRNLADQNLAIYLGTPRETDEKAINEGVRRLIINPKLVKKMSDTSLQLLDGNGAIKVVSKMANKKIKLRKVNKEDCKKLWHWANEPTARASAFSSTKIKWETHVKWFNSKLRDPNTHIFIAENSLKEPAGQIRFENTEGFGAVIDVNIDKCLRGLGLGSLLIKIATEKLFNETSVEITHAFIKPSNISSIKAFEKALFTFQGTTTINEQRALHYIRSRKDE